jgi:hypothetical protein
MIQALMIYVALKDNNDLFLETFYSLAVLQKELAIYEELSTT